MRKDIEKQNTVMRDKIPASERHLPKTPREDLCKIYYRCLTENVLKKSY